MDSGFPTYEDDNGYLRFEDTGQLVHRAVAQKKLGRYLSYNEVVHHLDMNKKNNNPENLYVCRDQNEHERLHDGIYSKKSRVRAGFRLFVLVMLMLAALAILGLIISLIFATNNPSLTICAIPPAIIAILVFFSLDNTTKSRRKKKG